MKTKNLSDTDKKRDQVLKKMLNTKPEQAKELVKRKKKLRRVVDTKTTKK